MAIICVMRLEKAKPSSDSRKENRVLTFSNMKNLLQVKVKECDYHGDDELRKERKCLMKTQSPTKCPSQEIKKLLKNIPEQQKVTGPLMSYLLSIGWQLGQMVFGKKEWGIPKTSSEATKREKAVRFQDSRLT